MKFPAGTPFFSSKDRIADWMEAYAKALEITVWTSTDVFGGDYDEASRKWTITVQAAERVRVIRPRHVIVATGLQGTPEMPDVPGLDEFSGTVLHSSEVSDGRIYRGQKAIVVGASASGHDIAQELWEQGASGVTLVQRSPSAVTSVHQGLRTLINNPIARLDEDTVTEEVDLLAASMPWPLAFELDGQSGRMLAERDREMLNGLHAAGYETHTRGHLTSGSLGTSGIYVDQAAAT